MEIQGKIIKKFPLRSGVSQASGKNWAVQEYLLETHDQYPRKVLFNLFGDRINQFPLNEGDEALVSFDIESRSFVGRDGQERWSTDIRAWKAELYTGQPMGQAPAYPGAPTGQFSAPAPMAAPAPAAAPAAAPAEAPAAAAGETAEDLPF